MKLRVNLYVQALQPVKEKISLKLLLGSTLGLSAVLLAIGLLMNAQAASKQSELLVLQEQVKRQEQQIKQLQDSLGSRQPAPVLSLIHI